MTPAGIRAAIAAIRVRPRRYGDNPGDLESYLSGLVAGAAPDGTDACDLWAAHMDAPISPDIYDDATFDSVCDHAMRVVDALWPEETKR